MSELVFQSKKLRPAWVVASSRNIFRGLPLDLIKFRVLEALLLFWPVVIALGPGFVALYYDHDVKSYAEQTACEQTLPELSQRAKQARDFVNAITEAAGNRSAEIVFQLDCIDKTPQDLQRELNSLKNRGEDGSDT
jgi:hypothetical protein